ncbi:MAG TPA: phosphotransferase [Candidatus Dormibacteraeota bacterium]|nr:phosphotransferase [Candidatus Dormibacteraeota bacterium]
MNALAADPSVEPLDPQLPLLAIALNRDTARREFKRRLPGLSGDGKLRLKDIRMIRHKPGRRCVVEYDVELVRPDQPAELVTLIGKTRARRSGNEAFRLQKAIWDAGFNSSSQDLISVPEPIGVISAFQMWFQRKVRGSTADQLLTTTGGPSVARRIVQSICKLHRSGVPSEKMHSIRDELRILHDCLAQTATLLPQCGTRLSRLMASCQTRSAQIPPGGHCGIHRDFYSSQVIIDQDRLWLLDFDLYCQGDPALDLGNFIAHVTEQSLRECGSADAMIQIESALEEEFVLLAGEQVRPALHLYRDLTLVRHIFLSTKFPERHHLTESLLTLCEARFR